MRYFISTLYIAKTYSPLSHKIRGPKVIFIIKRIDLVTFTNFYLCDRLSFCVFTADRFIANHDEKNLLLPAYIYYKLYKDTIIYIDI